MTPTTNRFTTTTPDSIQVTVTDNGVVPASATYTITITINEIYVRPTVPQFVATVSENCAAQSYQLSAIDPNGYPLTYALTGTPSLGSITNFNTATGAFTYTCGANTYGNDSISFTVNDGQGQGLITSTIFIIVTYVHQPPTASNLYVTTNEVTLSSQANP
jgi:hypothetical protein